MKTFFTFIILLSGISLSQNLSVAPALNSFTGAYYTPNTDSSRLVLSNAKADTFVVSPTGYHYAVVTFDASYDSGTAPVFFFNKNDTTYSHAFAVMHPNETFHAERLITNEFIRCKTSYGSARIRRTVR